MEDLHLESESATYLAQAGKEIHLTRHGIEFTDVKDEEKEKTNNRLDSENIEREDTKHLDQMEDTFILIQKLKQVLRVPRQVNVIGAN